MKIRLLTSTILSGVLLIGAASAADIDIAKLPAVSAFNGKVEFSGGLVDADGVNSDEILRGAASLSMPLGDMFGLQLDGAVQDAFGETMVGGNAHLFTRDPNSYLLGGIAGVADTGNATLMWAGGEAELYAGNVSFELAAGYLNVNPDGASSEGEFFGLADAAFYPTENLRLALGAASVANFESAHAKIEWMPESMPVSFNVEGRAGEEGYTSLTAGLTFYFGGNESSKSLMRRHREDDPRNRVLDVFGAGAAAFAGDVSDGEFNPCDPGYIYNPDKDACYPAPPPDPT
jgi:hypothetical protein